MHSDHQYVVARSKQWLEILGAVMDFETLELDNSLKKGKVKLENVLCVRRVVNSVVRSGQLSQKKCGDIVQHVCAVLNDSRITDNRYKVEHRRILLDMFEQPVVHIHLNADTAVRVLNYARKSLRGKGVFAVDITLRIVKALCDGMISDGIFDAQHEFFEILLSWFSDILSIDPGSRNHDVVNDSGSIPLITCMCDSLSSILRKLSFDCLNSNTMPLLNGLFLYAAPFISKLSIREAFRDSVIRFVLAYFHLNQHAYYNDQGIVSVAPNPVSMADDVAVVCEQLWDNVLLTDDVLKATILNVFSTLCQQSYTTSAPSNNSISSVSTNGALTLPQLVLDSSTRCGLNFELMGAVCKHVRRYRYAKSVSTSIKRKIVDTIPTSPSHKKDRRMNCVILDDDDDVSQNEQDVQSFNCSKLEGNVCECAVCGLFHRFNKELNSLHVNNPGGFNSSYISSAALVQTSVGARHRSCLLMEATIWLLYRMFAARDGDGLWSMLVQPHYVSSSHKSSTIPFNEVFSYWLNTLLNLLDYSALSDIQLFYAVIHLLLCICESSSFKHRGDSTPLDNGDEGMTFNDIVSGKIHSAMFILFRQQYTSQAVSRYFCGEMDGISHQQYSNLLAADLQSCLLSLVRMSLFDNDGSSDSNVVAEENIANKWQLQEIVVVRRKLLALGTYSSHENVGIGRIAHLCKLLISSGSFLSSLSNHELEECLTLSRVVKMVEDPLLISQAFPVLYMLNWLFGCVCSVGSCGDDGSVSAPLSNIKLSINELGALVPMVFSLTASSSSTRHVSVPSNLVEATHLNDVYAQYVSSFIEELPVTATLRGESLAAFCPMVHSILSSILAVDSRRPHSPGNVCAVDSGRVMKLQIKVDGSGSNS